MVVFLLWQKSREKLPEKSLEPTRKDGGRKALPRWHVGPCVTRVEEGQGLTRRAPSLGSFDSLLCPQTWWNWDKLKNRQPIVALNPRPLAREKRAPPPRLRQLWNERFHEPPRAGLPL